MSISYFITGTNTGVGKSVTTALLAKFFINKGYSVAVYKPIESGCKDNKSADLAYVKNIADVDTFNSYCLRKPLSPHLASKIDGVIIDIKKIKNEFKRIINRYDVVLVEGAGGVCVPINDNGYLMADLIKDLNLKAIITTTLSLGTINHSVLTFEYLKSKGIDIKGFIFNQIEPIEKEMESDNIYTICKVTGSRNCGKVEYGAVEFNFNKGLVDG